MPSAEVTTQTVRAEDGATVRVRLHRTPDDPSAPVLVCMPAMGTRAVSCTPLAEALVQAGFRLAAAFAAVYGYFPGRRLGVLGNDSAQILRDMATQVRTGRYDVPSSPVDFEPLPAAMDLPALAVAIAGDPMAPPGGVRGLCGKLTSARVTYEELALGAGAPGGPHYGWIRDNAAFVERVRAFADRA
ncbi:hypothetical protein [Streptomyces nojiriensis]|uniref:hypothetical protein n=1 Tax=Streptomyces nojiriensis TaxID=66374 RepID=UPI00365F7348